MLKPTSNRSLVSEDERVRYVDGTTCLTFWYDQEKQIIAFEVIFGLAVDEWAFLYTEKEIPVIAEWMMARTDLAPTKTSYARYI